MSESKIQLVKAEPKVTIDLNNLEPFIVNWDDFTDLQSRVDLNIQLNHRNILKFHQIIDLAMHLLNENITWEEATEKDMRSTFNEMTQEYLRKYDPIKNSISRVK